MTFHTNIKWDHGAKTLQKLLMTDELLTIAGCNAIIYFRIYFIAQDSETKFE